MQRESPNSMRQQISQMCSDLLPDNFQKLSTLSFSYYRKAMKVESIRLSRITDHALAVASVYIAVRLHMPKVEITQYDLSFKFNVSPMTIRKAYSRICTELGISRADIIGSLKAGMEV